MSDPGNALWLVGEHIAHSLSPAMHNAALAAMGEPPRYALRPTSAEALQATLDEAERSCAGINVTAPHKVAVARRYAVVLDDDARATGAVNTVLFRDGRAVSARNTDVEGLLKAWHRAAFVVEGRTVAVVGAGGAARAVLVALQQAGARGAVIHARRSEAATAMLVHAQAQGLEAVAAHAPCGASLLVHAASGCDDSAAELSSALAAAGAVHDLRYGRQTLALRNAALRAGHLYADGTLMLLWQGVAALQAMVGKPLPEKAIAAMRQALLRGVAQEETGSA